MITLSHFNFGPFVISWIILFSVFRLKNNKTFLYKNLINLIILKRYISILKSDDKNYNGLDLFKILSTSEDIKFKISFSF